MVGHIGSYFVVLPDVALPVSVTGRLPADAERLADHPSGRPWILGRLPAEQVRTVVAGERRLMLIGRCPVPTRRLEEELARLGDVSALDRIARSLPGSLHLVAAFGGRIRVQGSASGLRRVFHATAAETTVIASDRSDVLAAATGAAPDPTVLALRMLNTLAHPLGDSSVWSGVTAVPSDHYLDLAADGDGHRVTRWWVPPEAHLDLPAGADALRAALTEAVDVRTRDGLVISTDLSGGFDSTPLCYLASLGPAKVVGVTMTSDLDSDDDLHWARIALRAMPTIEHVIQPERSLPSFYSGLYDVPALMDEPSAAFMSTARAMARLELAREYGSRVHLDGLGGDQLLMGPPVLYHDLMRSRPLLAARRLRGYGLLGRVPMGVLTAAMADRRGYREWFDDARARLLSGRPPGPGDLFGWDMLPVIPPWFTGEAREAIVGHFERARDHARPLAKSRGRHADLAAVRTAGREVRVLHQIGLPDGPSADSPFLDDRVVEACLSLRTEERITPFEFKPLMKAAMSGLLPDEFLRRRTKTDGSTLAAEGFAHNRDEITGVWEDSRLARMGLIDPAPLLELTAGSYTPDDHDWSMEMTLACELWLRSRERG
ncbi:asparagine synthase-related protein [Marinactinospora thermotolerans]|uniref:asparagine synthase-related protein n=1 Tax=Marinactinospora thermotolerans TaxID=531310 RepID=UPI003D8F0BD9